MGGERGRRAFHGKSVRTNSMGSRRPLRPASSARDVLMPTPTTHGPPSSSETRSVPAPSARSRTTQKAPGRTRRLGEVVVGLHRERGEASAQTAAAACAPLMRPWLVPHRAASPPSATCSLACAKRMSSEPSQAPALSRFHKSVDPVRRAPRTLPAGRASASASAGWASRGRWWGSSPRNPASSAARVAPLAPCGHD